MNAIPERVDWLWPDEQRRNERNEYDMKPQKLQDFGNYQARVGVNVAISNVLPPITLSIQFDGPIAHFQDYLTAYEAEQLARALFTAAEEVHRHRLASGIKED